MFLVFSWRMGWIEVKVGGGGDIMLNCIGKGEIMEIVIKLGIVRG